MNENDVMAQLAEANPVRLESLTPLESPNLLRSRRRLVLVAVVVVAAASASLIGVFVFGGQATPSANPSGPRMPAIPPSFQPLADVSKILGAPVALPDTSLVQPSDAAKTAETVCVPKDDTVDPGAGGCQVTVSFPSAGLTVTYVTFPGLQTPQASYEQVVQQNSAAKLVSLDGVPALFVPQQESWIDFDLGGIQITVEGAYDEATLESIAQSIVDRTPVSPPTELAQPTVAPTPVTDVVAADGLLPFNVVLPSNASPTSLSVLKPTQQLIAYFDTAASGPYELVEGPSDETVSMLEETAKDWTVGPIHEIDLVDGVEVLVQGSSDGSLTASWLRADAGSPILTWVQGPETAERGQVPGTFTKQQALSVAGDLIAQGG